MKRFVGGVHPPRHKAITKDQAIRKIDCGAELTYPLLQHIGAPAVPIVKAGDTVCMGQRIAAAAEGRLSVPIHSAVSGTVKGVEPRLTVGGREEPCIVIENDGQYTPVEGYGTERDADAMSDEEILTAIERAGIVGLGGAGFPTAAKLRGAWDKAIDFLIFNGAECEPYLTDDLRLMLERTEELIKGIRLWMRLFPKATAVIGVENDKPEAIAALKEAAKGTGIRVEALPSRYPQGSERTLIYAITGRRVPTTTLPFEAGCIVQNIGSVLAGYDAVYRSIPLIRRVMTVTGDAIAQPSNFDVAIGTSLQTVIDAAGGFSAEPEKLIVGGPMTGTALLSAETPVTKTTGALLCLAHDEVAAHPTTNCIRCGRCVNACPVRLVPQKLVQLVRAEDLEGFEALGGRECISCGACSYGCPARIPLTQAFQYAKRELSAHGRKGVAK